MPGRSADSSPQMNWHHAGALGLVGSQLVSGLTAATAAPQMLDGGWTGFSCSLVMVAVIYLVVRRRLAPGWLLVWPVFGMLGLIGFGVVDHRAAQLVTGVITMFFLFVGLTQPPWRSWWLLPLALVTLRGLIDLPLSQAWVRLTVAAIVWSMAAELPALLMRRLIQQQQLLAVIAETDPLTGARNRHGLTDLVLQMRGHAFLVIVDLDHFKVYNDTFGHPAGDQVLVDFAAMLARESRHTDVVIRYGGEEFLIVLSEVNPATAEQIMQRWRRSWQRHPSGTTFSGGMTDLDGDHALVRADQSLYAAKAAGRARTITHLSTSHPLSSASHP